MGHSSGIKIEWIIEIKMLEFTKWTLVWIKIRIEWARMDGTNSTLGLCSIHFAPFYLNLFQNSVWLNNICLHSTPLNSIRKTSFCYIKTSFNYSKTSFHFSLTKWFFQFKILPFQMISIRTHISKDFISNIHFKWSKKGETNTHFKRFHNSFVLKCTTRKRSKVFFLLD